MFKKLFLSISILTLVLSAPVSADLIGYWKLDEGLDAIINDSSGYGHNGTIAPWNAELVDWTTDGYVGNALEFNTTTGDPYTFVDAPLTSGILNTREATYAFWMRMPQNHQPWGIIFVLIGETSDHSLEPGDAGELYNYTPWFGTSTYYNDNQWHHIAVTFSVSDSAAVIYVDGAEVVSNSYSLSDNITTVRIGGPRDRTQWASFTGTLDEVTVYNDTLSPVEIQTLYLTGPAAATLASDPKPADGSEDNPADTTLAWTPGDTAVQHNVYLGTDFDDVNDAEADSTLLVSPAQDANSYNPGPLILGKTYYWRIDEIDSLGGSYKGTTWSFEVEPVTYPVLGQDITATASSYVEGQEPENTINNSGLDDDGLHTTNTEDMWLSVNNDPNAPWIKYEFDKIYKLDEMLVWNYNGSSILAWSGINEVGVEYSADDITWTPIDTVSEFAQAPGMEDYASDITVNFNGDPVKYVRIKPVTNWSMGLLNEYGLSEVRFMYIPVNAREPNPASGATDVDIDVTLSWRAGREAEQHKIYISENEQEVIDKTTPAVNLDRADYGPLSLDMSTTYYWSVDEVNENQDLSVWQSNIWSFTTSEYIIVDDFEAYNEIAVGEEGSNLVYHTWTDGYDNPSTNGSTIGYTVAYQPSMETVTFHGGSQSVPLFFNNTTASFSEVTVNPAELAIGADWSKGAAATLVLWFYGDSRNATTQEMYVSINGAKATYTGDYNNFKKPRWSQWNVDLTSLSVNLSNVTTLTIGFERSGGSTGRGLLLIDDIRLYRTAPPLAVPTEPGIDGLVAHYSMENNVQDISGNGHDGTAVGEPSFVAGIDGMALELDGTEDYVDCGNSADFDITDEVTLSAWVKTSDCGNEEHNPFVGKGDHSYAIKHSTGNAIQFFIYDGQWIEANVSVDDSFNDDWHHVAGTYNGSELKTFIDGGLNATTAHVGDIDSSTNNLTIGTNSEEDGRYYEGSIDEVRIYNRALTDGEILYIADLYL